MSSVALPAVMFVTVPELPVVAPLPPVMLPPPPVKLPPAVVPPPGALAPPLADTPNCDPVEPLVLAVVSAPGGGTMLDGVLALFPSVSEPVDAVLAVFVLGAVALLAASRSVGNADVVVGAIACNHRASRSRRPRRR